MKKQFLYVILFLFLCLFLYGQTGDVHNDEGDYIVKNGDCTAQFTYNIIKESANSVMIKFRSEMPDSSIRYLWDFGDGSNSRDKYPVHTYNISKTKVFIVSLKVSATGCSDTSTQTISFSENECSADFTYKIINKDEKSVNVKFTVSDPDESAAYRWSFGDKKGTKKMNPSHIYKFTGKKEFIVKLIVTSGSCKEEKVKKITLETSEPEVIKETCSSEFTYEILFSDNNSAIVQFASSMANADEYAWDFGDKSTSNDKNPVHAFKFNGDFQFTVTLDVKKGSCEDRKAEKILFTESHEEEEVEETVTIEEEKEVVEDTCSAEFSFEIEETRGGEGVVHFTSAMINASRYNWDFGDGTTSSEENPVHTFNVSSKRSFTVILEVKKGTCIDKKNKTVTFPDEPKAECTAGFSYNIVRQDKTKGLVQFVAEFSDSSARFLWDFGDGTSSAKRNPVHTFNISRKQQFQVTLEVEKGGCSDTRLIMINFSEGLCTAEFTLEITYNDGENARVEITCKESKPDADFTCNFGDGIVSKEWNPVHTYNITRKKKYIIVLRVKRGDCDDQSEQEVSF